jgi:hypothetical protein
MPERPWYNESKQAFSILVQSEAIMNRLLYLVSEMVADHAREKGMAHVRKKLPAAVWPFVPWKKLFWLLHPLKAFYAFLLVKSLHMTWKLAQKYFK